MRLRHRLEVGNNGFLSVVRGALVRMEEPPQKSTQREILEATISGAVAALPVIGGPMQVALELAMGWAYNKRYVQWLEDLAIAVSELQDQLDQPLQFDELVQDPLFVDAVVLASRAAQATHQQEKLDALRNAVMNSTLAGAPSADEQARFLRLVDEFTPSHLVMLKFFSDPAAWFDHHGIPRPNYSMGGRTTLLEDGVPEFRGNQDWYTLLASDISAAGLMNAGISGVMTGAGMWQSPLSPLGQRFLAFVSDPRSLADS